MIKVSFPWFPRKRDSIFPDFWAFVFNYENVERMMAKDEHENDEG